MDPAAALASTEKTKDTTSAPDAAHWLAHPIDKPTRKLTLAQELALEPQWV